MSLPAIETGKSKRSFVSTVSLFTLIGLASLLPFVFVWFLLHAPVKLVEHYKRFWATTNIKFVNTARAIIPSNMRASILFNSLFDSDIVSLQFKVRGKKYVYRLGTFKKCFVDKADFCSLPVKVNKSCLIDTLGELNPFKVSMYYMSGAGKRVKIYGSDISYDFEASALILARELSKLFTNVCSGSLEHTSRIHLVIPVKYSTDRPNTRGDVAERYAEIDYSRQLLFLWKKGNYKMFKISGPVNQNYALGVYKIYSKSQLAWSEAYRAWMPYWLGYTRDKYSGLGVGIHALTYSCYNKAKFCSTRYRIYEPRSILGTPASDGCVRLSIDDAKQVFSALNIGDIVVVHK